MNKNINLLKEQYRMRQLYSYKGILSESIIGGMADDAARKVMKKVLNDTTKEVIQNILNKEGIKIAKELLSKNFKGVVSKSNIFSDDMIKNVQKRISELVPDGKGGYGRELTKQEMGNVYLSIKEMGEKEFDDILNKAGKEFTTGNKEAIENIAKSSAGKSKEIAGKQTSQLLTTTQPLTQQQAYKKMYGVDMPDNYARIISPGETIPKSTLNVISKNADEVKKVVTNITQNVPAERALVVKNFAEELADPAKLKKGWMGKFDFDMKKAQLIGNLKSWGILNSAGKMTTIGWSALTVLGLGSVAMLGALQETGVDMTEVSPEILPNPEEKKGLLDDVLAKHKAMLAQQQSGLYSDTGFGRVLPAQQARIKELLSKAGISGEELNQTTINQLYKFLQG
jgi:hypothetical protein